MKQVSLSFSLATQADVPALIELHCAVAADLTTRYGQGPWSSSPGAKMLAYQLSRTKFVRALIARNKGRIVGTLKLATKKPWAIDVTYFSPAASPLYLTGMAVAPGLQRRGLGRRLLLEAQRLAREWPSDAIRLDAFDADAGAAAFYAKCGYRDVGHVKYRGTPHVYFELLLGKKT